MPMPEYSENHVWVVANIHEVTPKQAYRAYLRHSIRVQDARLDVLETYCKQCRRPWEDVADQPCEAASGNEHLRGGPIRERKKRKHRHDCGAFGCEMPDEGEEPMSATG